MQARQLRSVKQAGQFTALGATRSGVRRICASLRPCPPVPSLLAPRGSAGQARPQSKHVSKGSLTSSALLSLLSSPPCWQFIPRPVNFYARGQLQRWFLTTMNDTSDPYRDGATGPSGPATPSGSPETPETPETRPSHQGLPSGDFGSPQSRPPINVHATMSPPPPVGPPPFYPPPPRGGRAGRFFGWGLISLLMSLLLASVILNAYMIFFYLSLTGGPHEVVYRDGTGLRRVVILPINGLIDDSTHGFVRKSFQLLMNNKPVAVILRVDSPGGYPGACDRIYGEIKRFRDKTEIPIVASFGSVAASGGYYVSAGCDWIVSEPSCITGSIGVLSQAFTMEKLLEKIGVEPEILAASDSPEKDAANNSFRSWDQRDREVQQQVVDHMHSRFIDVVLEGRQKHYATREDALAVGNGSIYNTDQALANKLVDDKGFVEEAIEKAKELAGLTRSTDPKVMIIHKPARLGLLGALGATASEPRGLEADRVRRLLVELSTPRVEYRLH